MAVKTKKVKTAETPSERFERIMQKVTKRQLNKRQQLEKQLR